MLCLAQTLASPALYKISMYIGILYYTYYSLFSPVGIVEKIQKAVHLALEKSSQPVTRTPPVPNPAPTLPKPAALVSANTTATNHGNAGRESLRSTFRARRMEPTRVSKEIDAIFWCRTEPGAQWVWHENTGYVMAKAWVPLSALNQDVLECITKYVMVFAPWHLLTSPHVILFPHNSVPWPHCGHYALKKWVLIRQMPYEIVAGNEIRSPGDWQMELCC